MSFEGQSQVDYCIECAVKHSQTAKVLMREALQRAEVQGIESEGVKEKIRSIVEELSGMEDDTNSLQKETIIHLNTAARELRKLIYSSKAEIGQAPVDVLRDIKEKIDDLVDQTYRVRELEECPTCTVKELVERPKEQPKDLEIYGKTVAEKRRKLIEEIRQGGAG